jgi:ATP-independent RNA helicase DbpA
VCDVPESLDADPDYRLAPAMITVEFAAGRKQKIRAGDLLGALTQDAGLQGTDVGKIDIFDMSSFVALKPDCVRQALNALHDGKVKGRSMKARQLR